MPCEGTLLLLSFAGIASMRHCVCCVEGKYATRGRSVTCMCHLIPEYIDWVARGEGTGLYTVQVKAMQH